MKWCGWRESNSHALRHWNLNPACIPISPHPHIKTSQRLLNKETSNRPRKMGWMKGLEPRQPNHNPGLYQLSYTHHIFYFLPAKTNLAHPAGLEPATPCLEAVLYPVELRAHFCSANLIAFAIFFGRSRGIRTPTLWSQTRCATKLRYAPTQS